MCLGANVIGLPNQTDLMIILNHARKVHSRPQGTQIHLNGESGKHRRLGSAQRVQIPSAIHRPALEEVFQFVDIVHFINVILILGFGRRGAAAIPYDATRIYSWDE